MFMPFAEVILHTISDYMRLELKNLNKITQNIKIANNKVTVMVPAELPLPLANNFIVENKANILRKLELIKYIGKFCLPSIFVIFCIVFMTIGLYLKHYVV